MSPGTQRKRGGCLRTLGGFVLVIAVVLLFGKAMELFWMRLDERRFPWGYPRAGRATLVGMWVGTLVTGGGTRLGLFVDIRMVPAVITSTRGRTRVRSERQGKLEGEVRLCTATGHVQRFTANGDTQDDRAAAHFYLSLYPADIPPADGLAPSHLRGRWAGGDSIALEADVHLRTGTAASSSTGDPDTGQTAAASLHRAGEAKFAALCSSP